MAAVMAPADAGAQISIPSITAPKQAAQHAANATNAQTAAMQSVDAPPAQQGTAAPTPPSGTTATHQAAPIPHVATTRSPSLALPKTATKPTPAAPKPVTPVAGAAAANGAPAGPESIGPDTGQRSISVTQRGAKGEVSLNREVYSYDAGARRDPFVSLMRTGDLRPMLSDLRLSAVLYDPTGRNSVAVMRDQSTKDQYRVRVGETLGRMRVAQIEPKDVVFTIEEVGFSRQEALALGDSTKARKQ
jgi:hypothetical protein